MKLASLGDLGSHVVKPGARAQNAAESHPCALNENTTSGCAARDGVSPQPQGVLDHAHLVAVQLTIGIENDDG
jgi:hypothetical protein